MSDYPWGRTGHNRARTRSHRIQLRRTNRHQQVPVTTRPRREPVPLVEEREWGAGYVGYSGPHKKGYIVALILTFLFGPLGLFYATKKGALVMLVLLVGVPVVLGAVGVLPGGSASHPFAILDHDSIMNRMWSLSVVVSMVMSVVGVGRYNAKVKS